MNMKQALLSLVCIALCFIVVSCRNEQVSKTQSVLAIKKDQGNALSPDAKAIIDRLNAWDKDEIDVYERPKVYPNRITSGETNGYIMDCKERLAKLGVKVKWNPDKKLYEPMK